MGKQSGNGGWFLVKFTPLLELEVSNMCKVEGNLSPNVERDLDAIPSKTINYHLVI